MIERLMHSIAIALSYVWELVAMPAHAFRLAALRLARWRTEYEFAQAVYAEHSSFRAVLWAAEEMERELAEADLVLSSSREVAVAALLAALARLKDKA